MADDQLDVRARVSRLAVEEGFREAVALLRNEAAFEEYFRAKAHHASRQQVDMLPDFIDAQALAQYLEDVGFDEEI